MIKCEVIKKFTLGKYDLLKNIKRVSVDTYGKLYVGDTFECTEEMAEYLMGKNDNGDIVIKIIEIIPEKKKENEKPKTKKRSKKSERLESLI